MKKVLSLVLAFAMILGSFGFVFASQFPDVEDTEYYSEAVNVLSGFGVIGGFPDGTFKPEKEVTRAEMATMVVNALGMTVSGKSDTKFSDVPASHWASGFIAYATSVGFVAGYPDGTFKPEDPVTYDQALTMIVAALGYQSEALPGSWPGNFVNKAQGLGILDTCKTTGTANAPREDVACFLYDALDQPIGYTDKDGAWHANIGPKNPITGVYEDDTMYVRLGAEEYDGGNGAGAPFVVEGDEEALIDMSKYFGAYVIAYASKDDADTIVAIKEVLSEFVTGEVTAAGDAIEGDTDYKIPTPTSAQSTDFKYFDNGDVVKKAYAAATGSDAVFAVKKSGNKISEIYSVQVWTPIATFRAGSDVQEILEDDQTLNTYSFVLDDDDAIDESEFIMLGKSSLADLAEDDIITIYLDSASKIAKLEVSTEKIEGTITKINTKGDVYTIAGTDYDVATGAYLASAKATGLQPEAEGTFFLNYAGEIAAYDETKSTTKNYGVVLTSGKQGGIYAGDETPYIKIFMADGNAADFTAESDIFVNGAKTATTIAYDTTAGEENRWMIPTALVAGTVVEYEVDSDNVLVGLTTLTTNLLGSATKFDANGVINGYAVTADTVIFSYTGTAAGDEKVAKNYSVLTAEDVKSNDVASLVGGEDDGDLTAVMVTGVEESSKIYAIFASEDGKDANGKLWTALYDGDVKTLTLASTLAPTPYTTSAGVSLYTLTFDGDTVKKISTPITAADVPATINVYTTSPAAKLEVNGATFKLAGTNYSLAEDAAVYIYDESDKKWSKGKLSNVKYNYLEIIGTGSATDEEYDIVIVTKD